MRLCILSSLLAVACSEYSFNPEKDPGLVDTSSPSDSGYPPDDVNACDDPDAPRGREVPINTECETDLQTGSFTPVVEWSWGSSSFCGPPAVGQIVDTNGSGAIDTEDMPVIVIYQNGKVVALYGDGSGPAWQTSSSNYGQDGGFAIGDVTGDGWPNVITASSSSVCALDGRNGSQIWCNTGLGSSMDSNGYNYPAIADMDGDGRAEVTMGNVILDGPTGNILGRGAHGRGTAPYHGGTGSYGTLSVPIDLDGDGVLELVTGNAAYNKSGGTVWHNGGRDGLVAVADFTGDGKGEIVKTSGHLVYGMRPDGTEVWGPIDFSGGQYASLGTPAIDDLDGDGVPEIVFAARNALIALEWGGAEKWRTTIQDGSGAAGPVLFDFEMDGYPEVLYADETSIRFFSGLDGSLKYTSNEHSSYTILETPVVADVDNDGQVEIVLGHCSWNRAVTVYGDADGTWPEGRKIWNQHAYYITNVDELGRIPSPTASNFSLYNSFRSGDVGRPPAEYWDLLTEVLDVCEDECEDGLLYLAARPLNAGNLEAPIGIPVSLRAGATGPVLDVQYTTTPIPAGYTGEMLLFVVNADDIRGRQPVVTSNSDADGLGTIYECDSNNNSEIWPDQVCR